jgi:hypothetical protein
MNGDNMMPSRLLLLAFVVLSLTGCNSRLQYEKTLTAGPGNSPIFQVEGPRREQKVVVTFTSDKSPVDVYVTLDPDSAAKEIEEYKQPSNILAKKLKATEGTLEATVPAKKGFGAIVAGAIRDTKVQIKMEGK